MGSNVFSSLEIDAIGEILNISLGASATAVSTMLSRRVDITIPVVQVCSKEEFKFTGMEPAVGVEIVYVSGLEGKNVMLLKRHDVKVVVEILMDMEISDEDFELNEINMSAVCEVMNQMMGASSTALSEFLGEVVNISPPKSFEINTIADFKEKYLGEEDQMVVISFSLCIENAVESEFLNVMTLDLARKLLSCVGLGEGQSEENAQIITPNANSVDNKGEKAAQEAVGIMSQDQIEKIISGSSSSAASTGGNLSQAEIEKLLNGGVVQAPEPPKPSGGTLSQEEIEKLLSGGIPASQPTQQPQQEYQQPQPVYQQPQQVYQQPQQAYQQPQQVYEQPQPKVVNVRPFAQEPSVNLVHEDRPENLDMLMDVALEVSVEIGRTKKFVKEILEYTQGSLVILDTLAGDQVDVFVNGQCIAKGDVVVVDDCFGVRITEVLNKM